MPDYAKGKIYAIRSHKTTKVYIGSTTGRLDKRFINHKHDAKKDNSCKSKELFQYEDVYIELIQDYPCKTAEELRAKEAEIIKATPNTLNKLIPGERKIDPDRKEKDKKYQQIARDKKKEALRLGIPIVKHAKCERPVKLHTDTYKRDTKEDIDKYAEIFTLKYKIVKLKSDISKLEEDRTQLMNHLLMSLLEIKTLKNKLAAFI
jgi:hypothetical protein